MTDFLLALLVSVPIVGLAAVVAVFVTRLVDARYPLPDGPVRRDPEATVGIPLHWAQQAAAEGERRRVAAVLADAGRWSK